MTIHIATIDSSLSGTGWAVIRLWPNDEVEMRHGLVPTAAVDPEDYYRLTMDRIRRICARVIQQVSEGVLEGDKLVVAIEGPSYGSNGAQDHARGGLWWLLFHLLSKHADAVVVIPPKSSKAYMGNGNWGKPEMVAAVQRAYPGQWITDDNEADALALAGMVARHLGYPQEQSDVREAAMAGVRWPRGLKDLAR